MVILTQPTHSIFNQHRTTGASARPKKRSQALDERMDVSEVQTKPNQTGCGLLLYSTDALLRSVDTGYMYLARIPSYILDKHQ